METLARIAIRGGPGRYAPVTTYGRVGAATRPLPTRTLPLAKRVFAGAPTSGMGQRMLAHITEKRPPVQGQERARAKLTELTQ